MQFGGIQKLTLLDYPGKLACTLFTAGCNLRCPFCHNASLVLRPEAQLEEDDVLSFLRKRRGVLQGVCLTGGEPLLQNGAERFLSQVREMGFSIKLDTNGTFPARLRALAEAGLLDYVAMDVKNAREFYGETAGIPNLDTAPIDESIRFLLEGAVDYEFRTTVVRELHNTARLLALADWISGAKRYFLQAFQDSGELICPGWTGYSADELHRLRDAVAAQLPCTALRGI